MAGCISLATAFAAPVGGRLTDRFGAARVLPGYAMGYAVTQLGLLAAVLNHRPVLVLCALAALSGALFPALNPTVRAAWTVLTADDTGHGGLRRTAMAAESALFEIVFVIGPLLLSVAVLAAGPLARAANTTAQVAGPATALSVAAVVTAAGTAILARGRAMQALRPEIGRRPTHGLGPLRVRRVPALLGCASGVAFSFGAAPVSVAAYARAAEISRAESVTGVLIAVWSLGSAAAGLGYGIGVVKLAPVRQLTVLLGGLAVGYTLWALAPGTLALGVVMVLSGAVIAPAMTVQAELLSQLAPRAMLTEAYTWLTTTNLSLAALGSAVAGAVVDGPAGATGGFLVAAGAALVATGVAAWPGALAPRPIRRHPSAAPDRPSGNLRFRRLRGRR